LVFGLLVMDAPKRVGNNMLAQNYARVVVFDAPLHPRRTRSNRFDLQFLYQPLQPFRSAYQVGFS
jgi:hypothetical protein